MTTDTKTPTREPDTRERQDAIKEALEHLRTIPPESSQFVLALLAALQERPGVPAADVLRDSLPAFMTQPVGIPEGSTVTLTGEDIDRVCDPLLDAIRAWNPEDEFMENYRDNTRFRDLTQALHIMVEARLAYMQPCLAAHEADAAAAKQWESHRWLERSRLDRQERQANVDGDVYRSTARAR